MQSTSLCSSSLPFGLFSSNSKNYSRTSISRQNKVPAKIFASHEEAHDQNCNRRLVDENMIVLRKRIHEMKMVERNYEPPSDWMDWEKRYSTSYDSFIFQVTGILQSQLMNTRPSLALGTMALILLSVPTSTALVLFHFMEMTKGILAGIH